MHRLGDNWLRMHTIPQTLEGWLRHCEQLHPVGIDMGLERVREVAHRMSLKFDCPVITVAGTNGKGSTCAMLEAVALQAGYRTGVYTSPHLVHFQERCRVHGEIVGANDLLAHFEAVEAARTMGGSEISLTYFEFTTLAILRLMSHALLDVAILEVGLGGRLDATNIIDADCAIITSIDIDHIEYLGPDRETIGREKAGIMRTGRPAGDVQRREWLCRSRGAIGFDDHDGSPFQMCRRRDQRAATPEASCCPTVPGFAPSSGQVLFKEGLQLVEGDHIGLVV